MDIALLFSLIVLNGIFAMSEIALITSRRTKLATFAANGDGGAVIALKLGEEPTRFLSTVQIGITSIGILNGIVGEAALAGPFAATLQSWGLAQRTSEITATVLVVAVITYFSIVIGELVPKRIGQINPEGVARLVARPMRLLAILSRPFVYLLAGSTSIVLRLLGQREAGGSRVTEEEIHAMLVEGSESGVIEKNEHAMVRNIFRLDDRLTGSLMVPRTDIVWLDADLPLADNMATMAGSPHDHFPVCRGGLDNIIGVASAKRLLSLALQGQATDFVKHTRTPTYVPESLSGMELLEQFRTSGAFLAFVVDEYGDLLGMVTLRDVIEAVTGQFTTADPDEARAVQRADGSWLLDGLMPVVEVQDLLALKSLPDEDKGRYHTLSGLILWLLGSLPGVGETAEWEGWRLEVVDLDGKRIDKVLASRLPAASPENADSHGGEP
ncbi:MAG: hemolysin family protein [Pigmentiphaga sp.]|nr:hemolysin family protein [Pigmentiphaga sp.]